MGEDVLYKFALSGASGAVAEIVTFPVDLIKTRLQLQGERGSLHGKPLGAMGILSSVVKTQGLGGLYAGVGPAVARHVPYTGIRIMVYEKLRQVAISSSQGGEPQLLAKLGMGMTAGALGQLAAVPADLIKVRMQADGRLIAAGKLASPRYRGLWDGLRTVVRQEGLLGLWRGSTPAVQRAALVNLRELTTYDQAKRAVVESGLLGDHAGAHAAASVCSGLVSSLISTPADVIKTRLMNQGSLRQQARGKGSQGGGPEAGRPQYRGVLDCLSQAVRKEGVVALYKGFFPTWARLGPWQLCFWLTYEQLRRMLNLPSF